MSLEDLAFPPTTSDLLERLKSPGRLFQGGDQTRPIQPQPLDFSEDWGGDQRPTSESEKINIHARNLLALDLGTYTGWSIRRRDGSISHGMEHFIQRRQWHEGQRFVNFRAWLGDLLTREQIHHIVYELVVFGHNSSQANNVYGAFWGQVLACAAVRNIECQGVAVPTVKKCWTGHGHAKKQEMISEARRRGFRPTDDNAADALAILHYAISKEDDDATSV